MNKQKAVNKHGFTLMELLVVVIIIGVLAAIAVPGYMRAVEKSRAAGAIQTLSDIAKAESDYYNARSKYTNDFGDLVLTMTDENTMEDADHSSYKTKFFTYNLDNNQDAATASRQKGDDSYTLYRFYEDPITYCQPQGNKYCEALGLPAGQFTRSIGAWQSCPGGTYPCSMNCARGTTTGYSCYGTYNEDGTFTEKVCSAATSSGLQVCTNATYDEDGKRTRQVTCDITVTDKCITKAEKFYDEYGNLMYTRRCTSNDDNGNCTAYSASGADYTYDANGNKLTDRKCKTVDSSGNCTAYNSSIDYTYDANGNKLTERQCSAVDSSGNCTAYDYGYDYTYDANGNKLTYRHCSSVDSNGNCTAYNSSIDYTYDANGNKLTERQCSAVDSSGNCTAYDYGYDYTYDANGNKLTYRHCSSVDSNGNCTAYSSGTDYTYDANGNMLTKRYCSSVDSNGNCTSDSDVTNYTYDANGNMLTERYCSSVDSNGNCTSDSDVTNYTYDANGNMTSKSGLECWTREEGVCRDGMEMTFNYAYDENGNQIYQQSSDIIYMGGWPMSSTSENYL